MKKPKPISHEMLKTKLHYHELAQLRYLLGIIEHFSPNISLGELRKMLE